MPETITSSANPLVKLARSLRQRKAREKSGLFLVEGILPVGEAAAAGWDFEVVLYAPELLSSGFANQLISEQSARGVRCVPVSSPVFEGLAEKENPQGLLAIVRDRHPGLQVLNPSGFRQGVAMVAPQDPGNIGTVMRSIDAVGADGLILLEGGVDPFHPTAVRASMGTLFWKPVIQATFAAFIGWARQGGYRLLGTSAHGKLDFRSIVLGPEPWVLVLGNEQKGLSRSQAAACDEIIRLPMRGRTSSLNLAVAAGVLLYSLMER